MTTLTISTSNTDLAKDVVNFNDLNDPMTHLKMLKGHYTDVICEFPTDNIADINIIPDVACMISRYNMHYKNAKDCPYPVKTFFPLMVTKVRQEILDLCILRGLTVARMVNKYGEML